MSLDLDKNRWVSVRFGDVVNRSRRRIGQATEVVERYVAGGHFDDGALEVTRYGEPDDGGMGSTFTYTFNPGDVLYVSASWYLRKVGVATFGGVVADKTYVLRTADPKTLYQPFLPWLLLSDELHAYAEAQSTGSMNARLLWGTLSNFEFLLPSLDDQKRIAHLLWTLERHSRDLAHEIDRLRVVEARALGAVDGVRWPMKTVAELGEVQLGQQLHPKYRSGPRMRPYLRVANVGDDELFLGDVRSMDFSDKGAEKFRLAPGDILLNEGQSIELVGRCAMFRGEIEPCYMQKTLLRFRAGPDILPEFALAWFRRCYSLGEFAALAKRTTTMAHLTAVRFAAMPMPLPERDDQLAAIRTSHAVKSGLIALRLQRERLASLRSALLAEIFGGV